MFAEKHLPKTSPRLISAASVPVALSCGTLFVYSVYGTQLADRCGLDTSLAANLNISATVGTSVGGLLGGFITDVYGSQLPVFCSLLLLSVGYNWLQALYNAGDDAAAWQLSAAMFCIGIGATASYFASLKAVTVSFPKYKGTAQSFTIASFAISSLLYSLAYTKIFHGDVAHFLLFLAVSSTVMQGIGVLFVRIEGHGNRLQAEDFLEVQLDGEDGVPLIDAEPEAHFAHVPAPTLQHLGLVLSLMHPIFWIHFFLMAILQGMGQMYIYSLGFVVKAIHTHFARAAPDLPSLHSLQALHVSLVAVFSFAGRLTAGPLSDSLVHRFSCQRHWVTLFGVVVMFLGHFSLSFPIDSWSSSLSHANLLLSFISCTIGFAYGLCFTSFPGIMADLFSMKNYSLIWGIVYSSTVPGLAVFTKLFGYVYDRNSTLEGGDYVCDKGSHCYSATFEFTSLLSILVMGVLLLYIHWRRPQAK